MGALEGRWPWCLARAVGIGRALHGPSHVKGRPWRTSNEECGRQRVALVDEAGGRAGFVRTHVSVPTDIEAMVAFVVGTFGGLDCAQNNACLAAPMAPLPTTRTAVGTTEWSA